MTSCACSWNSGDAEQPKAFWRRVVKARKRHYCCECGEWVEPGERYQRASGVWALRPASFATCTACAAIREDRTDGVAFGQLYEALCECEGWNYLENECVTCDGSGWEPGYGGHCDMPCRACNPLNEDTFDVPREPPR